jgi:hypothetical protein
MGNADVGNRGQANLAFALISLKRGNKGVEHRRAIDAERADHGGHSGRERNVIRDPTRRRCTPTLLDSHDRIHDQARVDEQSAQSRFLPKAQLRRQRGRRRLRSTHRSNRGEEARCKLIALGLGPRNDSGAPTGLEHAGELAHPQTGVWEQDDPEY